MHRCNCMWLPTVTCDAVVSHTYKTITLLPSEPCISVGKSIWLDIRRFLESNPGWILRFFYELHFSLTYTKFFVCPTWLAAALDYAWWLNTCHHIILCRWFHHKLKSQDCPLDAIVIHTYTHLYHLSPQMWMDSPHKRNGHCSRKNNYQNNNSVYHNFLYGMPW